MGPVKNNKDYTVAPFSRSDRTIESRPRVTPSSSAEKAAHGKAHTSKSDLLHHRLVPEKTSVPITGAAAQTELKQVLASQVFAKSPRIRHLLQHIVLQWSSGNSDKLDGYNLALDVFKREASFESALDPIVRVEMARLRVLLAKYYAGEGCYDRLRIDIPKGAYVPLFTELYIRDGEASNSNHSDCLGSVIVLPFLLQGPFLDSDTLYTAGVYDEILYLLTRLPGMRVVSRISATQLPQHLDARLIGEQVGARFIVEGSVLCLQNTCLIAVHLSDAIDGYNLWSERYLTSPDKITDTMVHIVEDLAAKIESSRKCASNEAERP